VAQCLFKVSGMFGIRAKVLKGKGSRAGTKVNQAA